MKEYTIKKICAWCKKVLGTQKSTVGPHPTHGICKKCSKIWLEGDEERPMRPFEKNEYQLSQKAIDKRKIAINSVETFIVAYQAHEPDILEEHLKRIINEAQSMATYMLDAKEMIKVGNHEDAIEIYAEVIKEMDSLTEQVRYSPAIRGYK
jgi:hypothetical protein